MSAIAKLIAISKNYLKAARQDGWPVGDLTKAIQDAEKESAAQNAALEAARDILGCPFNIDPATVSKQGIAAAPEQVVLNVSVSYLRWKKLEAALAALPAPADLSRLREATK